LLKASIALVGVAFAALAVGWVTGLDILLYASIVCSALGGVALLKSTLADRKSSGKPAEDEATAKPGKKEKKPSRRGAKKQKKLSKRDAKKQEKARVAEDELLEETSSVRAIEGAPAQGAASTPGHDQQVAPAQARLGQHAGVASTDSSEGSVVDFRSRLAAALDTSSLEDPLLLEDENDDEDDGLLASRLRAKDAVTSALAEIDDEVIDDEPREDEGEEEEEEELAFVRAPGHLESSFEPGQEEDALDWIRIDDLPRIAESFRLTKGSRQAATKSPSVSAARRTATGSAAGRPAAARSPARRSTTARSAPSRVTATKAKDRAKASPAGKGSARKAAPGAKQSGASQSRASSKPKQAAARAAGDSSSTRKRAASAVGAKPASKAAQPGITGSKRGSGRPAKAKP
jgi:hypothetical protein